MQNKYKNPKKNKEKKRKEKQIGKKKEGTTKRKKKQENTYNQFEKIMNCIEFHPNLCSPELLIRMNIELEKLIERLCF